MKRLFLYLNYILAIIFSINSFAQTGWQTLSLNPGSAVLNSVYSNSQTNCLAFSSYTNSWSVNFFKVYKTTNSGLSWDTIYSNSNRILLTTHFIDNMTGYAGCGWNFFTMLEDDNGTTIFKTTNGGYNWNTIYNIGGTPLPYNPVTDLYFLNVNTGWACNLLGQILRTTNGGQNFLSSYTSPVYKKYGIHFTNNLIGFTVGDSGYFSSTTNGGANWNTPTKVVTANLRCIYFLNQNTGWIAGYGGTILKTTNGGINWFTQNSGITNNLNSIYFYNTEKGWAVGNSVAIATTNGGNSWTSQSFNPLLNINALSFSDSLSGWMCGGNKIYKTQTGGWIGINKIENVLPDKYELFQNYPNPFNPETKIRYVLKSKTNVVLKIYDILGRKIMTLVDANQNAGTYEVTFDGRGFASSVYFYKLEAGEFKETKKLILVK